MNTFETNSNKRKFMSYDGDEPVQKLKKVEEDEEHEDEEHEDEEHEDEEDEEHEKEHEEESSEEEDQVHPTSTHLSADECATSEDEDDSHGDKTYDSIKQTGSKRYVLRKTNSWFWKMYKKQMANFWPPEDVKLDQDIKTFPTLSEGVRTFIEHTLAFFASIDGIVLENLGLRFMQEFEIPEIRNFYVFQMAMEGVHSETYSNLIEALISDATKREKIFAAIETMPSIQELSQWALKWISSSDTLGERLLAFCMVEGVMFSSAFCSIYYLNHKVKANMPGLIFSNELISRDEGLHANFAAGVYERLAVRTQGKVLNQVPQERVYEMVRELNDCIYGFVTDSLPVKLIGMEASSMMEYVHYVSDRLLKQLGFQPLYNVRQLPFDWMHMIGMLNTYNFFERPQTYSMHHTQSKPLHLRGKLEMDLNF